MVIELKESYYKQACANLKAAENLLQQLPMFPMDQEPESTALAPVETGETVPAND